jgi:hypothetical protein
MEIKSLAGGTADCGHGVLLAALPLLGGWYIQFTKYFSSGMTPSDIKIRLV